MKKYASRGLIDRLKGTQGYLCFYDWPEDCQVQCGESGLVLAKPEPYYTAFFEAFPRNPNTFIRGEGETVELAERDCWGKYQKILNCPGHEFEARGRKDGVGWCKHCDLFLVTALKEFLSPCCVCGKSTGHFQDTKGLWYCFGHTEHVPDANLTPDQLGLRQAMNSWRSSASADE